MVSGPYGDMVWVKDSVLCTTEKRTVMDAKEAIANDPLRFTIEDSPVKIL